MTKFLDGPATGIFLSLRRAPIYLRVVWCPATEWDALDQLDDAPRPQEIVYAYRLTVRDGLFVELAHRGVAYPPGVERPRLPHYYSDRQNIVTYREPTNHRLYAIMESGAKIRVEYNTFTKD